MDNVLTRCRSDGWALLVLALGILLLFLPVAAGWRGIFQDDQAMAEFPWHYFLAAHFQKGEIPLWDQHTWCGAIPFYARYYADTYYFPLWPLYLLTRLGDLTQAYWTLSLIPLFLHYLLAGLGMYRFARRSIRLHPYPALLASWVYVFSPAFAYSYVWFPIVAVQAWLPWLLGSVVEMDRRPGFPRVAAGAIFLALMSLAAQPPHLGYGLAASFLLAFGLALRRLLRREFSAVLRAPTQLTLALALSFLLAAVYWFSALDGLRYTEQHLALTYQDVAGQDGSLPPIYLATIFVPDLFGGVDGMHLWGGDVSYEARYWEANTSGGLLLIFLTLSGVVFCLCSRRVRRLRFWALAGSGVWVFALFCMLGRHTPFYRLIFKYAGFLSQFPFPIRYRMLQCLAAAWLAGLGAEALFSRAEALFPKSRAGVSWPSARLVWGYLAVAAASVGLALLWPQDLTSGLLGEIRSPSSTWAFPGVREVAVRGEGGWFWLGPFGYFLSAAVLLVLAWRGLRGKARIVAALSLVMLETAFFSLNAFYFCTFERRFSRPEHFRVPRPPDQPLVARVLGPLTVLRSDPNVRWATDQPFHDNFARLNGSSALMGYDMKPLEKRFKRAIEAAYQRPMDWPIYWHYPRAAFTPFLSNFSVGYLMDINPISPFAFGHSIKLEPRPPLFFHMNAAPLPRVFTLDRIVEATADEQLRELVGGDLRRGVFMVDPPPEALRSPGVSIASYREIGEWAVQTKAGEGPLAATFSRHGVREEMREHFRDLQEENAVTLVARARANAVVVECAITVPAMLVFTDVWYPGWRAKVDDRPAPLHRVNYCQRGVWLEKGRHRVELRFAPTPWVWGAIVSLVSWPATVIVWIAAIRRRRARRRPANRRKQTIE